MAIITPSTEYNKFYAKIWDRNTSKVITIPDNIVKGLNLKTGDEIKVYIKINYQDWKSQ